MKRIFFYFIVIIQISFTLPGIVFPQETEDKNLLVNNYEKESPMLWIFEKWSDLTFGNVNSGTTAEVTVSNSNAALFHIFSDKKAYFTLSFILPSSLTFGGNTIPITFDQNHTVYNINSNTPVTGTNFNPYSPVTFYLNNNQDAYIWIGGIINIPGGAAPGTYTATITLNVDR